MRKMLAILVAALATAPLASSSGSFSHDDSIPVTRGAPLAADAHNYDVLLAAGDTVTVTVAWASGTADLDVHVVAPAGTCALFPDPDAGCIAGAALSSDPACVEARRALTFGPAAETVTLVAPVDGTYLVAIIATVAAPQLVDYHVEIQVDGLGGSVTGPESAVFLGGNAACKLPLVDAQ